MPSLWKSHPMIEIATKNAMLTMGSPVSICRHYLTNAFAAVPDEYQWSCHSLYVSFPAAFPLLFFALASSDLAVQLNSSSRLSNLSVYLSSASGLMSLRPLDARVLSVFVILLPLIGEIENLMGFCLQYTMNCWQMMIGRARLTHRNSWQHRLQYSDVLS